MLWTPCGARLYHQARTLYYLCERLGRLTNLYCFVLSFSQIPLTLLALHLKKKHQPRVCLPCVCVCVRLAAWAETSINSRLVYCSPFHGGSGSDSAVLPRCPRACSPLEAIARCNKQGVNASTTPTSPFSPSPAFVGELLLGPGLPLCSRLPTAKT